MKKIVFIIALSLHSFSGTFMSSTGSYFKKSEVNVRVASNSSCSNAGTNVQELIEYITPAIENYWNEVTTSRLELINGKELNTTDALFSNGKICVNQSTTVSCVGVSNPIPKVTDIVIACNDNVDNYSIGGGSPSSVIAITLPNNILGSNIVGAIILINDTASSPFSSLTEEDKIAVLAHEIGHAIGIGHTTNNANLMFWTPTPERFALGPDDVQALTYLYPKKFDGCGIGGTIKDSSGPDDPNYLLGFLFGLMLSFFFVLTFIRSQKFFLKFKKPII